MDRHSIIVKIQESADKYGVSNKQEIENLTWAFKMATDRELFFGLFSFFYDPDLQENSHQRQLLAGTMLFQISPKCPLKMDGAIYASPSNWDKSVKELPWYFCKAFGKSNVQAFLEELLPNIQEGEIKEGTKAMLDWVNACE